MSVLHTLQPIVRRVFFLAFLVDHRYSAVSISIVQLPHETPKLSYSTCFATFSQIANGLLTLRGTSQKTPLRKLLAITYMSAVRWRLTSAGWFCHSKEARRQSVRVRTLHYGSKGLTLRNVRVVDAETKTPGDTLNAVRRAGPM